MTEHSIRDLYRNPNMDTGESKDVSDNLVWVEYAPRTFYFSLGGRFTDLTARIGKRRRRRLTGKLKGHIRAIKQSIVRSMIAAE